MTVGFTLPHVPLPEPELPEITAQDAIGHTLLRLATIGRGLVLVFDNGYVTYEIEGEGDAYLEEGPQLTAVDMAAAGLITQEAYAKYEEAKRIAYNEAAAASRREQYEKLKKEFEK